MASPLYILLHPLTLKILQNGADVNARIKKGLRPLTCAMNITIAKIPIQNGANCNAQDEYGWTA